MYSSLWIHQPIKTDFQQDGIAVMNALQSNGRVHSLRSLDALRFLRVPA